MFKYILCEFNYHTRIRCPDKRRDIDQGSQKNTESLQAQVNVNRGSKNPFVKTVSLNEYMVNGLIDFGCSNVLVSPTVPLHNGLIIHSIRAEKISAVC